MMTVRLRRAGAGHEASIIKKPTKNYDQKFFWKIITLEDHIYDRNLNASTNLYERGGGGGDGNACKQPKNVCYGRHCTYRFYTAAVLIKMLHFLIRSKNSVFQCSIQYYTQCGSMHTLHQKCLQHSLWEHIT
jgi:hypothetical protein